MRLIQFVDDNGATRVGVVDAHGREVCALAGDVFEIELPELGAPLRNRLRLRAEGFTLGGVRVL